jgi:hypothetical protein
MPFGRIAQQFVEVALGRNGYQMRDREPAQLTEVRGKLILILPEANRKTMPSFPGVTRLILYQSKPSLKPIDIAQNAFQEHGNDSLATCFKLCSGKGDIHEDDVAHVYGRAKHSVSSGAKVCVQSEYERGMKNMNGFSDCDPALVNCRTRNEPDCGRKSFLICVNKWSLNISADSSWMTFLSGTRTLSEPVG